MIGRTAVAVPQLKCGSVLVPFVYLQYGMEVIARYVWQIAIVYNRNFAICEFSSDSRRFP